MTDLRLAPLTLDAVFELIPLRNNPDVQVHLRNPGLVTADGQRRWYGWLGVPDGAVRMFGVECTEPDETWSLIGCAGLTGIDWQNRRAELSVYTVPPTHELEAARLVLRHAFLTLGLHRVEAETLTGRRYNLCKELGFTNEGIRRGGYWRDGFFIDAVRWGRLADDEPGQV